MAPNHVRSNCFEYWNNTDEADAYQYIEGLPQGTYKVCVQGFYRRGLAENEDAFIASGDFETYSYNAWLYAESTNDYEEVDFALLGSEADKTNYFPDGIPITDYYYGPSTGVFQPNSMEGAKEWFNQELYENSLYVNVDADGKLQIGFVKAGSLVGDWLIVSNWRLYYLGKNSSHKIRPESIRSKERQKMHKSIIASNRQN